MSAFEKRPYRELVADTQESRDRYFAALREYYLREQKQTKSVKQPWRIPIFVKQPEELEATPQPPKPPPLAFRETEPAPPPIETVPQVESIPETEKLPAARPAVAKRVSGDEWRISERHSQRLALMVAETAHQRNLADIADQRFRQWARTRDFGYDDAYAHELPLLGLRGRKREID